MNAELVLAAFMLFAFALGALSGIAGMYFALLAVTKEGKL